MSGQSPTPTLTPAAGRRSAVAVAAIAGVLLLAGVAWVLRGGIESMRAATGQVLLPPLTGDLSRFRADTWYLPDDAMLGFVEIPAGPFVMGSDPVADPMAFGNERWVHTGGSTEVELPTYYIGRFEVTVAQYRAFVEATGHRGDREALAAPGDHPVALVSWPDALAYSRWLDRTLRDSAGTPPELEALLREGWRITLPTEVEWEKAARGTDGRIFPWGDRPAPEQANFMGRSTVPVGSFGCEECPWGIADMSGNVWEWTRSPFQATPYDTAAAAPDLREDALWVMRGGSFVDREQNVRAAVRGGADPGARRPFIGFRLALSRY
jgi:formylglycine-generating enzyme required for sulfatase activity